MASSQRGASVPIAALLLAVSVGVLWVILQLGVRATRLAQAQTAADAAALAAVMGGEGDASHLAIRNHAGLVRVDWRDGGAVVTASVDGIERMAAAEAPILPAPNGLAPAMAAAVATTEVAMGATIPIVSGRRTLAEQRRLWEQRHDNPNPVAYPGTSRHELGLAIDVALWFVPRLTRVGALTGLCRPLPVADPVHFELCRRK